jgi:cell division protease FtsH
VYSKGTSLEGRFKQAVPSRAAASAASPQQRRGRRRCPGSPAVETSRRATSLTELPPFVDPGLERVLIDHGVEIRAVPIQADGWSTLLFGFGRRCS